jgi:hypothetical protein
MSDTTPSPPSVDVPTKLPSLPSVEDSCWRSDLGVTDKAIARLKGYVESERVVWWRLDGFHGKLAGIEPKWHVFAGRLESDDPTERWSFRWLAQCGYENLTHELLSGARRFAVSVPKKDDRCRRCVTELDRIKAAQAITNTPL